MKLLMENWRQYVSSETLIESYMGDWAKHSTLNIGQVARHLRYFFDLPDTPRLQAAKERAKFIFNDLIYAVLPPQVHHTPEEVEELTGYSYPELFKMGYDPNYKPEMDGITIRVGEDTE